MSAHDHAFMARALPLARNSVQMVWSNLMLSTLAEPMPASEPPGRRRMKSRAVRR